jgi:hypothetical protein
MSNDTVINEPAEVLVKQATTATLARCVYYAYDWETLGMVMRVDYYDANTDLVRKEEWIVDQSRYKGVTASGTSWQDVEDNGVSVIMNNVINNDDLTGVAIRLL